MVLKDGYLIEIDCKSIHQDLIEVNSCLLLIIIER